MESKTVVNEIAKLISLQVCIQIESKIKVSVEDIADQKNKVVEALDELLGVS